MSIRSVVAGLIVAFLLFVPTACTVTSSSSCSQDPSVVCAAGDGWSCTGNDTPADSDSSLDCSDPTDLGDGTLGYCCISGVVWSASTCQPDSSVSCDPYSYGYTCAAGDDPTTLDPTLNCSSPTPDGAYDTFCCQ